jgi:hypothetical protein
MGQGGVGAWPQRGALYKACTAPGLLAKASGVASFMGSKNLKGPFRPSRKRPSPLSAERSAPFSTTVFADANDSSSILVRRGCRGLVVKSKRDVPVSTTSLTRACWLWKESRAASAALSLACLGVR